MDLCVSVGQGICYWANIFGLLVHTTFFCLQKRLFSGVIPFNLGTKTHYYLFRAFLSSILFSVVVSLFLLLCNYFLSINYE